MIFKNWRKKEKFKDIYLLPGDSIQLVSKKGDKEKVLVEDEVEKMKIINEARTFDAEVDGREAIGGVFISKSNK
jgi:hypothetical protein